MTPKRPQPRLPRRTAGVSQALATTAVPVAPAPSPAASVRLSFIGSRASLTSWAIQLFSAGPVSHVDAVERGTGLLWGARFDRVGGQPRGFYPRPASYIAAETVHIVVELPCTPEQQAAFWAVTRRAKGEEYDWRGVLGFALDDDWHRRGTAFCSEIQRDHLQDPEVGIFPPRFFGPAWKTTPMELLLACTARNDTVIVSRKGC